MMPQHKKQEGKLPLVNPVIGQVPKDPYRSLVFCNIFSLEMQILVLEFRKMMPEGCRVLHILLFIDISQDVCLSDLFKVLSF